MKTNIYNITWSEKRGKPAVSFEIVEVSEETYHGAHLPVKGGKTSNHDVEISNEIDSSCDKKGALGVIKEYLEANSIVVQNFSLELPIK